MSVLLWIVVGYLALGALANVFMVGKEREPTTPGIAVASMIITFALILLILIGGGAV